jgi:hypothetical protein
LAIGILILVLGGRGILELQAFYISLLQGDVGKDVKEVGRGDGGVGEDGDGQQGAEGVETRDQTITVWARVIPGVMGTVEEVLDDLAGGGDVLLVDVVNLRPRGGGEGEGGDGSDSGE